MTDHNIRDRITDLTAASIIADPKFPDASLLPRLARVPSNNLGHLPFLDYQRLCRILWGMVGVLRKKRDKSISSTMVTVGVLAVGAVVTVLANGETYSWQGTAMASVATLIVAGFAYPGDFRHDAAAFKANQIRRLLKLPVAQSVPDPETEFDIIWGKGTAGIHAGYGRGILSEKNALVLFADGIEGVMPGLGKVLVKELFLCPSQEGHDEPPKHSPRELLAIARRLTLRDCSVRHRVDTGVIVVVDPSEMGSRSPFLAKQEPLLQFEMTGKWKQDPLLVQDLDPSVSARVFAGIQVLFKEHSTLATFAIRFYIAGTSIAFEIVLLTLGPPVRTRAELLHKLVVHQQEANPDSWSRRLARRARRRGSGEMVEDALDVFRQKADYSDVADLFPFDASKEREAAAAVREIETSVGKWGGSITRQTNIRDWSSLSLPKDFFGAIECRATIRSLYEQITRTVLNELDDLGYDISTYRDEAGRWTVGNIENMIVSENIGNMFVGNEVTVNNRTEGREQGGPASQRDQGSPRTKTS